MADWVRVAKSDESPSEPNDPRVDLSRCELWFRDERNRGGHYAGETALYRTPGGRWLFVSIYVDEFTRESRRHAWWPYGRQIEEAFLRHPEIEPPSDVAVRLEPYDATLRPVPPKATPAPKAPAGGPEPAATPEAKKIKEPSREALTAYRVHCLYPNLTQAAIAKRMEAEFGLPFDQSKVSRYLGQVRSFLDAGNVLPDLPDQGPKAKTFAVDPARLDKGARQDGRRGRNMHGQ